MKRQSFANNKMLLAALTLLVYALASSQQVGLAQEETASVDDIYHSYLTTNKQVAEEHSVYAYLPADHLDINTQPKTASFPGGNFAYTEFIRENFQYPEQARMNGCEGEVRVSFYVNTDGTISHIKVQKSVSPEVDAEVVRVIEDMPDWFPAVYNDREVRSRLVLPVDVRLK